MNAPLRPDARRSPDLDVAIIGAGLSGLGMAIALKREGRVSFRVFEKAPDLGGTWYYNTYPGCACDIPSHLYSYSFEQNPDWSRSFSPGEEIWRYLKKTAEKYALGPHLRFQAKVTSLKYDESAQLWRLAFESGEAISARAVVAGVGALHVPALPDIAGLDAFAGAKFHSAEWNNAVDLTNKNVAIIGTGASAVQIAPAIAPKVKQLYVFQRTAPWVLPRLDKVHSARSKKLFARIPALQRLYRAFIYWTLELRALGFTVSPAIMKLTENMARGYLQKSIRDPKLQAAATPDYRIGCKRILISDDYYPILDRANVELVTAPIARAERDGLRDTQGRLRAVDVIIYATGFDVRNWLGGLRVTGRGGRSLQNDWRAGASAYYGTTVAGYPNLFLLLGPNTGLGHNSVAFMIESQIRYTRQCLGWLFDKGVGEIEIRDDLQRRYNERLQKRLARTVWLSGCKSWYLNENGTSSVLWPGFSASYWWKTRRARRADYRLSPAHEAAISGAE